MDHNTKAGIFGGIFCSSIFTIGVEDLITTIVLAVIGAVISFIISVILKYLLGKIKSKFGI